MNKVFKVIWSEARNAYVVVSEIAKNMGSKSCSTKKLLAMLIATGVMTCAGMAPAMAANLAPNDTLIAIGKDATVGQRGETNSIAVGYQAEATAKNAIAIGYQAKANVTNAETSENATTNEQAVDPANAIAIGYQAEATNANAAAIGYLARASGENAAALGYNTIASGKNSIALGNKAEAIAENATALGNTAKAHGVNSTALGAWASTDGTQATAVGYHSEASALESTAIGNNSSAAVTGSVALGSYSVANREANSSTGYLAPDTEDIKSVTTWTANKAAVSVGGNGTTRQIMNVAAGEYDTDAVNVAQLRVVNEAAKAAKTVIKAGDNVTVDAATDAEDGHTIYTINATDTDTTYSAGNGIKIDSSDGNKISVKLKEGEQNLSFDEDGNLSLNITQAVVYKDNDPNKAIMSTNAGAVANDATIALGKGAEAQGIHSIVIGDSAKVGKTSSSYSIAVGYKADATGDGATAIGPAVGKRTTDESGEVVLVEYGATASGDYAIALGAAAQATGRESIAIGLEAKASSGIAIGRRANVSGENAIGIGNDLSVSGSDAVAVGVDSHAYGKNSTALGASAHAWKEGATAVGAASAYGERSTALGYKSYAEADYSVALGNDSVADRKAGSVGYLSPQEDYSAEDSAKPEVAAWKANLGAVSVGSKLEEGGQTYQATRQITNVAAGSDLTDAVNVAQLQVVKAEADKHTTLTNGKNTTVKTVDTEDGHLEYQVNVQGALTDITSITNGSSTITLNNGNVVVNKVTINSDGRISGVANGTADNDAVNVSQLNALKNKQAVVYVNDNKNNALKSTNASRVAANAAIALGKEVYATGENSIAIGGVYYDSGHKATTMALGKQSTAIGIQAITEGNYSTAVGNNAHAYTESSVAIGNGSVANREVGVVGLYAPTGTESGIWKSTLGDVSVGLHYTDEQGVTHYYTRQITHVAAGSEDTDAVNVAQLKTAKTEVAAGTNVTSVVKTQGADGQDIYTINTKDTTYSAGDNVTIDANNKISATDTKYTAGNGISIDSNNNNAISVKLKNGEQNLVVNQDGLSLNQNLNVTSVNAGGTVINNGGLTIGGNTYVSSSGLNASGQKIINVANGTEDRDAVNYGQLKAIEQTAGKGWNVSTNGGTDTNVAPGDTVDFTGDSNISVSNEGKNVKVALKNDISVNKITTNYAYVTNVDETNNSSVTNVEYVNKQIAGSALSAGNGIDITNKVVSVKLKEGEQNLVVDASGLSLNQEISVSKVTTNNAYVTNVDASKGSSVTNVDYVNQKAAAAKTEVAAGTNVVSVEKTQGGNGQDIYTVNAKDTTVSGDSNISATAEDKGNNVTNYKLQLASDLTGITSISNNNGASIKLSNSNVVVNNKVTINSDGRISGVADGDISKNSKDAVNGSQLYEVQQQAGKHSKVEAGTNTNVEATNQDGQMVYKVNLNSDILLKDLTSETGKYVSISGTEGTITTTGSITTKDRVYAENGGKLANIDVTGNKISNGSSSITMDGSNVKVNDKVTIDQTGKISGVADGDISKNSKDAVNGSQLNDTNNRVTKVEGDITNIKTDIKDIKVDITNINTKLDEHTTQINQNTQNITNLDNRVTEVEKTAGKHSSVSTEDSNIIIDEGTNTVGGTDYKLSLNKNQVLDSVKTGDTVMNNDGIKVGDKVSVTKDAVTAGSTSISNDGLKVGDKTYVNSDGLNANSQKVTNVADGEISATSKDAVNGSQLHAASEQIIDNSNRISRLGNRINKVGAGAAALAALHPMDFDPDDKWSFAAGYGNYAGENAAAIGAYYRPDEKVMFSVGGTVGNGENMVNAGISFALDRTNHVSNSRTALAREVIDLRSQLVEMGAKMAKMEAMLGVLDESKTKLFPDVPANHWAYEYIAKLAGNGILEGYPDGTFGGDRLMTRYEFATMLYRAIEKGAALEERIINEFAPELGRIRVDRISGKDSDRNKIERVRVNGPRSERDHYGSKLK